MLLQGNVERQKFVMLINNAFEVGTLLLVFAEGTIDKYPLEEVLSVVSGCVEPKFLVLGLVLLYR